MRQMWHYSEHGNCSDPIAVWQVAQNRLVPSRWQGSMSWLWEWAFVADKKT